LIGEKWDLFFDLLHDLECVLDEQHGSVLLLQFNPPPLSAFVLAGLCLVLALVDAKDSDDLVGKATISM